MKALRPAQLSMCLAGLLALSGCGNDTTESGSKDPDAFAQSDNALSVSPDEQNSGVKLPVLNDDDSILSAVIGASEIPYPVYPNGSKYRVGGENGLKIVVFQTEDSFDKVDEYYKGISSDAGMPRLTAMNDYVRYSSSNEDKDPWATYRPGIVIHQFNDDRERRAVGAKGTSRTNIIMSF